ncbi:Tex family protein [Desulfoplanes formicivorans]|uniref:Tex family protein n=1 Tax=Desulfoplanes formicivorans TaxID=1592317 RepID=UPI0008538919
MKEQCARVAREMGLGTGQVEKVAGLLGEGATVPFIARYRKEMTGDLDEVAIAGIRDGLARLAQLDQRREAILASLGERDLLTAALRDRIAAAESLPVLEDIYLPYRPKRRTKAAMAREKGLAPLAKVLLRQQPGDVDALAGRYVDPDKGVMDGSLALEGARHILAEMLSEDGSLRKKLRRLFATQARIVTRVKPGKQEEGIKFKDYFAWSEKASQAPSHRILAVLRGEREGVLGLRILPDETQAMALVLSHAVQNNTPSARQVELAARDAYKRLLAPSMETELRGELKKRADQEAIRVFAENLRQLLMAPPLGPKRIMGLDPGFRTGVKLVCLDEQGGLVHAETIFPFPGDKKRVQAARQVTALCTRYHIQAVAIGNGTAGRETESFVRSLDLGPEVDVVMVNESGASVYSASRVAREEFPHHDVTVRGAVSIARRLMDPLAELVKIDPKAIGVGQYQHDVDQKELKKSLEDVVVSCVNQVGVDVNWASKELLTFVSGLGPTLAAHIVAYRNEHGPFTSRKQLLKVKRLGPKAFEQAAGFLRIRGGKQPLDGSAVHPERYPLVETMARDLGCTVSELMASPALQEHIRIKDYVTHKVGLPTLRHIMAELKKPGRDPRSVFKPFVFADNVAAIQDLQPGMRLPGIVTNVTRFGAFVDVGVHQDGLVHISQLADRYVKDPADVVKVGQQVEVAVLEVNVARKRISLSMRAEG